MRHSTVLVSGLLLVLSACGPLQSSGAKDSATETLSHSGTPTPAPVVGSLVGPFTYGFQYADPSYSGGTAYLYVESSSASAILATNLWRLEAAVSPEDLDRLRAALEGVPFSTPAAWYPGTGTLTYTASLLYDAVPNAVTVSWQDGSSAPVPVTDLEALSLELVSRYFTTPSPGGYVYQYNRSGGYAGYCDGTTVDATWGLILYDDCASEQLTVIDPDDIEQLRSFLDQVGYSSLKSNYGQPFNPDEIDVSTRLSEGGSSHSVAWSSSMEEAVPALYEIELESEALIAKYFKHP